jgi:hypothetical protein
MELRLLASDDNGYRVRLPYEGRLDVAVADGEGDAFAFKGDWFALVLHDTAADKRVPFRKTDRAEMTVIEEAGSAEEVRVAWARCGAARRGAHPGRRRRRRLACRS